MGSEGTAQAPWRPFLAAVGALAVVGVLGLAVTAYVALRTSRGLRLDSQAMDAVSSPAVVLHRLYDGLTWVTVGSVGLSLLACVMLAVVRRRLDLALGAVVVIGGANVTTQILKYDVLTRPEVSAGPNSLPSGHTTVALSIALAAVIVAPSAWRSTVAIGVSATATLVGVATVLGRWHQPSDVVAATFVCVVWAAVGLLAAALVRHRPPVPARTVPVHVGALIGASAVGALLVSWGVRPQPGLRDLGLGIISLGAIGLACAVSVAAVAHVADRHLG
ncbi:MAG: phosphatase PAP2 family protein [Actinobacteria bacterium]|nr:phosphatase PAP2 family protein [Actinomycetota bacterium]